MCDQEIKDVLERWADTEGRTVSNLVERIVQNAVAQQQNIATHSSPPAEKLAADKKEEPENSSKATTSFLENSNQRLNDRDCIAVAREIGIPEELALKLCDHLFEKKD